MELRSRKVRPQLETPSTSVKTRKPPSGNTPDFSASEKIGCKTRPVLESNVPAHKRGFEEEKVVAEASDADEIVEQKIVKTESYGKEKEASEESSKKKKKKKKQRDGSSSNKTLRASSDVQREGRSSAMVSETKKKKKKDETSRILFSDANEDAEALEMANMHEECHKLVLSPSKVIYTKDIMDVVELVNLCGNDKTTLEEEEKSKDQDLSLTSDIIQDLIRPVEENLSDVNGSRTPSLHKWSGAEKVFNEEMKMQSSKNTTEKNKSAESKDLGPFSDKFDDQSIVVDGYTKCIEDNTLQYKKKSSNKKKKEQVPSSGYPIDDDEKSVDKNTRMNVFDELKTPAKKDWSDASKTSDKGRNTQPGKESAKQKEERSAIELVGDTSGGTSHEDDDKPMHDSNTVEGEFNSYPSSGIKEENIILKLKVEDQAIHGTNPMQTSTSFNAEEENGDISSDEDDDAEEMAEIFAKSIKEYMQQTELSVIGTPRRKEEKKENSVDEEKTLSVMLDDSCSRSSSLGRIWCPETGLSSFTNVKATNWQSSGNVMAESIWRKEGKLQDGLVVPPIDPLIRNKLARKQKDNTAGAKWFNLSAPTITPELKKELQILKLRGVVDPKRHYKADDSKGLPKYFEVGTVIGGPTDFYSGRLTKKEQKCSLADELLADSSFTAYRKRKYLEIQEQKQAGGKSFWKKTKSKRTPAWAKI